MDTLTAGRAAARPRSEWVVALLLFAAVALLARLPLLGNPVVDVDEQFYLLVGGRLLHGALPFVDIWDRKPIGLFLIYAAASLFGSGVIAYQLMAWASVTATCLAIYRLARMIAPMRGAVWAAVSYPLYLMVFNCAGGQSPVFYNLLVALAAWLLVEALDRRGAGRIAGRGAGAMVLIGLAMQVKYTAVFEGVAFGLALLRAGLRRRAPAQLAGCVALWVGCALLPTALAWAWFAAQGHGAAFVQANFASIFGRNMPLGPALWRLAKEMAALTPFWLAIALTVRQAAPTGGDRPDAAPFLRYWAGAAVLGFLVFGSWLDHYVAPLLPPLAVISAPAFGQAGKAAATTAFMLAVGLIAGIGVTAIDLHERGSGAEIARATALIEAHRGHGCLYLYEGPSALYRTTGSCLPTRFAFPSHLSDAVEANALGASPIGEERRIIATRPPVVVIGQMPLEQFPNTATRRLLTQALARDYVRFASVAIGADTYDFYQPSGARTSRP